MSIYALIDVHLCFYKITMSTSPSLNHQTSRINDVLYFIHSDISAELPARKLAEIAAYSEQHFHRVFKSVVGESVHQYIRRSRLEFAANQLMFDTRSSVVTVATKSGFASVSSFSRAFKATFAMSPGEWRSKDLATSTPPYLRDPEIAAAYSRIQSHILPRVQIIELPERHVAYVRHQGYGRSIRLAWQTLVAWANVEGRSYQQQFGLHHSNPAFVGLEQCRYVACLAIDKPLLRRGMVNSMVIPGGLHAVFKLTGKYGELLPYLSKIIEQWLPSSGFKMQSTPAYVHYQKNHFLDDDEQFELQFCLPISTFF